MQIASIVPHAWVEPALKLHDDEGLPCRTHLLLTSSLGDDYSLGAYTDAIERGHTLILDNDAWETQQGASTPAVVQAIRQLAPNPTIASYDDAQLVIVLTDVLMDAEETVQRSIIAAHELDHALPRVRFSYMIVPQGRSLQEWTSCLLSLLSASRYFPRLVTRVGITRCVNEYVHIKTASSIAWALSNTTQHLLGFDTTFYRNYLGCAHWWGVGSIDTAKPAIWAMRGREWCPKFTPPTAVRRPRRFFEDDAHELRWELYTRSLRTLNEHIHTRTAPDEQQGSL